MSKERLLKAEELAERLGVGKSTVYRMFSCGVIPSVPVGSGLSCRRFNFAAVCSALEKLNVPKRTYHPPKDRMRREEMPVSA